MALWQTCLVATANEVNKKVNVNKYLEKIAAKAEAAVKDKRRENEKFSLRPHQQRVLEKLKEQDGVLVDHSTGSGKTGLFLSAISKMQQENPKGQALVIAPASLVNNVAQQAKDLGIKIDPERIKAMSYEKAVNQADHLRSKKFDMVVCDEGHKLRNANTKRSKELSDIISGAHKRIIATATSTYNHTSDIAPLVNLAAGKKVLPSDVKSFNQEFVEKRMEQPPILQRILGAGAKEVHVIKNKKKLGNILNEYVDKYELDKDPSAKEHFPTVKERVVEVPMSGQQHAIYRYLEGRLPFYLRMKVRMGLPLDKKDSANLNAFSQGIRQASNSVRPFMPNYEETSPKIKAGVDSLEKSLGENKKFRGIVYSNYLEAGLNDYSRELQSRGIKHGVFHGALSATEKQRLQDDYNNGKIPVLLLSSSGSEGLNLKQTRKVIVAEPHFNPSKIKQVIGRSARFKSHSDLPVEERNVEVERYHSVFPSTMFGKAKSHSIDQYLYEHSKNKDHLNNELKSLIKSDE